MTPDITTRMKGSGMGQDLVLFSFLALVRISHSMKDLI